MHLLELSVMFGLFGFEVKFEVILFFQIFVLDFFSEPLLFSFIFLKPSFIFFFDSLNHVIKFLQMIMMSPFHFLAFSHVLIFKNLNVSSELFLKASDSCILDWQ